VAQPTKVQRWLDLIAFLVSRSFPVSGDDLMRAIPAYAKGWNSDDPKAHESTRRMFERDKDELRQNGIPIRTVDYSINQGEVVEGYQIDKRDFYLPYLSIVEKLDPAVRYSDRRRPSSVQVRESEIPLALDALKRVGRIPGFPLQRESRSAFRKLAFALEVDAFDQDDRVLFVDTPGAAELSGQLRILSEALRSKKRVRFTYNGIYRGTTTERDVAPYGLLFQHGNWYLVGHDATRDDIRVFRVGRMSQLDANTKKPGTPDYAIPSGFRLSTYADRDPWSLGDREEEPLEAVVRFAFPLSLWAERNGHGQLVETEPDGGQVRSFQLHQVDPFLRWVLSLEDDARILSPDSLIEEYRRLARSVVALHGGGGA
jgi:predicted DNA-binding transcriptional regulator YafY